MELEGGDLADYQGTQAGFELAIQDKYETTISRSWGEIARTLRTLYQVGQGEFVREPKAPSTRSGRVSLSGNPRQWNSLNLFWKR